MYVDYDYYAYDFGGTDIPFDQWASICVETDAFIDAITFGRVANLETIPTSVKNAVCAAAEEAYSADKVNENGIGLTAESNDGYSVSYGNKVSDNERVNSMFSRARLYLVNTGLMFKGWSRKYDNNNDI